MKGIVFNQLQEFVELNHGLMAWDEAITQCDLPSNGIYVGTQSYSDAELFALVEHFCGVLGVSAEHITRAFGEFVFERLFKLAPIEAQNAKNLRSFLLMIEDIIHVEVMKLYQDANLPSFDYEQQDDKLLMIYHSPRKMCFFSEGLIYGAASHFNEEIKVSQSKCMHTGDDCCHLEIEFV